MKQTYKVKDRGELIDIISKAKDDEDLNYLDVSGISNMARVFQNSKFNGDISKWNVSKVENMFCMFLHSSFNGDISDWNVKRAYDYRNTWSDNNSLETFNKSVFG